MEIMSKWRVVKASLCSAGRRKELSLFFSFFGKECGMIV